MTFDEIYLKTRGGRTVAPPERLHILYDNVVAVSRLEGSMAEVGVYRGGTSKLIGLAAPHKNVYSFEGFQGLPEPDKSIDKHSKGEFTSSYEDVRIYLSDCANIKLYKGYFPDENSQIVENLQFCFVHLDVDLYLPTLRCLEFFWPRLVPGGMIISDDYMWHCTPGVDKAIEEFINSRKDLDLRMGVYQAILTKLG